MRYLALVAFWLVTVVGTQAAPLSLRESLGMFETGANQPGSGKADRVRGKSGEVSRFQILPSVWHRYTSSTEYDNPEVAWYVTQRILSERITSFRSATGRDPNALEIYLLWNKPGSFQQ